MREALRLQVCHRLSPYQASGDSRKTSLCIGPPVDNGFYYEMALPGGAAVQNTDWKPLETIVSKIVKEKQKFERLIMVRFIPAAI